MFRVHELFFVEGDKAWAVSLVPDTLTRTLNTGEELIAGQRRWKVIEIHTAPAGLLAARLEGPGLVTRGLIMRPATEEMGSIEFKAGAILLVRLARACRAVDVDGILARLQQQAAAGDMDIPGRAIAKSALMAKHLVESGATDDELTAAAHSLGLEGEI